MMEFSDVGSCTTATGREAIAIVVDDVDDEAVKCVLVGRLQPNVRLFREAVHEADLADWL